MANSKRDALLAALASDSASVGLFSVGKTTEELTHAEIAAALGGTAWPDDTPFTQAVTNAAPFLWTHSTPDANQTSRNGKLAPGTKVNYNPATATNGFVQLDSKVWVALQYLTSPYLPTSPVLAVPYHSELTTDANAFNNDCGVACIHMLLDFVYAKQGKPILGMTTNQLSLETPEATNGDAGLPTQSLVDLAGKHGVKLAVVNNATLDKVLAEVDAGRPPICLITYAPITSRNDKNFGGGHFVVVIGYSPAGIILNDPDWPGNLGGHFTVPIDQFIAALATAPVNYQSAFLVDGQLTPTPGKQAVGVDLSHWNTPDMPALEAKVDFVFDKATQGLTYVDPDQANNKISASRANPNALWGVFHFGNNDPADGQIDNFIRHGLFDGHTVAALDVETDTTSGEVTMSLARVVEFVQQFHAKTGVWITIYTSKHMMDAIGNATPEQLVILDKCPLWVATDSHPPTLPIEWNTWTFDQDGKTSEGFDADRFNGDATALRSWWTANAVPTTQPAPVPVPKPKAVGSAIGFHIMPRANLPKIMDVLKVCAAAGKPVRGVKLLLFGNDELPEAVKQASPQTEVAVRIYNNGWEDRASKINWNDPNLYTVGHQYATDWLAANVTNNPWRDSVDHWQILNEPGYGIFTSSFWTAAMDVFIAAKRKCLIYGFPVGTPQLASDNNPWWTTQVQLIERIIAEDFCLSTDEYGLVNNLPQPRTPEEWQDVWSIQRHTEVLKMLPASCQNVKWVNAEFGTTGGAALGADVMLAGWKASDDYVDQHGANMRWRAAWTFGTGGSDGWLTDVLDDKLDAIQAYLLAR